jgi:hypothetical protein
MATEAQINANRLNSQKSTGPRTDENHNSDLVKQSQFVSYFVCNISYVVF